MDDLIVEAATVITVDPEWKIHAPGYIAVKDGRISAIGPADKCKARSAARRVEAPKTFIMPGFVNAHTHISMAAFRGACEDIPNRLTKVIFPLERDLVTRDLTYWSALYCLVEMARSGTTTFADMYYFEDEVAKATNKAGLRAILGETILGHAAPDAPEGYGGIEYARGFIAEWQGHPRIAPCFAPHAPYTVDSEHLASIAREAESLDVDIMMHVAEMDFEHEKFSKMGGSVLRYLDSIPGLLSPRLLAAHMLYLDEADIALAAERGLRVAHCPASNAKSGRLICPAFSLQAAGIPLGLATDGPLSGNGMDMQGVLNLFPKMQKVREGRRDIVTARDAVRTATLGGAEALGLGGEIGSLEIGKKADFILVDLEDFNIQPVYDWYSTIVYAMRPHNVVSVFVDGYEVVAQREMTGFDQGDVFERMRHISLACSEYIRNLS
ncbi:MAG: amidohydrolase [Spirochaetia bacterium]|jgi:cytosine/adenosine deaminase-related metal-dependent hydrolase|nr:amidohydrolase [Spirochaetia bacterium]